MVTRTQWRGAKHQVLPSFPKPVSCQPFYMHRKGKEERAQDLCSVLLLRLGILTPVQTSMNRNAPPWKRWNGIFIAVHFPLYQWHRSYPLLLQPALQAPTLHVLNVNAKAKGRRNESLHPSACRGRKSCYREPVPTVGSCSFEHSCKAHSKARTLWGHARVMLLQIRVFWTYIGMVHSKHWFYSWKPILGPFGALFSF